MLHGRGAAWLALAAGLWSGAWLAPAAWAGAQAERAIAAAKQLVAAGEVKPGTVLRLTVKQGNIAAFLGRGYELQNEWERRTGILIDANVMPQLDSLEFVRRAAGVDLTVARNHEYPDLYDAGLIEDLAPYLRRFGFSLSEDGGDGFFLLDRQAYFGERLVAIPADGDVAILYLRRDLLEDPAQRARFKERYQRELKAPRTWREYRELVEFFHKPEAGFYGSLEPRERLTGWMYWMPRYASLAFPNQYLFDDQMRPLIDSPAGVAATESYVATVPFSPPDILTEGKDYNYTLPLFVRGNGFATILTMAGAKIFRLENSAVRDKFMAVPMPGHRVGGRLQRRTTLIYGNNLIIPRSAPNKALAFLYAMWLTDADISARSVSVPGGFADPYRYNHLRDERIRSTYTPQALDNLRGELPVVTPSGTGVPGDAEYLAVLNDHLALAARREISPGEAMARTARAWEAITERRGRAQQIAHWQAFKKRYPPDGNGAAR